MSLTTDPLTLWLVLGVLGLLGLATAMGWFLRRQRDPRFDRAMIEQFNLRLRAWWLMCAVLAAAFLLGSTATVVLFFLLSFWALREFITLTPTRAADHRALFWVFTLFTPLQYLLVGLNLYEFYSVVIPVYGFLFVPIRIAVAGDFKRYLERCAKIQSGLMICVYCLSFAPALLSLEIPEFEQQNDRLLFFFILVVTLSDAFHYTAERLIGRHVIAPLISTNRTWEGYLATAGCATLFGASLYWATPFSPPVAAGMSFLISTMGFFGGLTMSAIKRDRGVQDYGTLVAGHGGILDRIDSICFAAPVFFHATRYLVG